MFFRITEYTLLTILFWLFFVSVYLIRWSYGQVMTNGEIKRKRKRKRMEGWLLLLTFVLINGYDQHRVIRANNFDIPTEELSDTELHYRKLELDRRKLELDRQKAQADKIKQVDRMIDKLVE